MFPKAFYSLGLPPNLFGWFVVCLNSYPLLHAATNIYYALSVFNKLPSASHFLALGSSSAELGKKKASLLCWSSRVPPDRSKQMITILVNEVYSAPAGTGTHTRKAGLFSRLPQIWRVGDGTEVN